MGHNVPVSLAWIPLKHLTMSANVSTNLLPKLYTLYKFHRWFKTGSRSKCQVQRQHRWTLMSAWKNIQQKGNYDPKSFKWVQLKHTTISANVSYYASSKYFNDIASTTRTWVSRTRSRSVKIKVLVSLEKLYEKT